MSTKKLVQMAMLCALSIVLVYFIHFPIFPAAPFLKYDPADIPIFIGAFLAGPIPGFIMTVIVSILQTLIACPEDGIIGCIMHIVATGSFVLCSGFLAKRIGSTMRGRIISLAAGVVTMVTMMIFWNLLLTPIYMNATREQVLALMLPVIIPFNLIKAGVNAVVAFVLYNVLTNHNVIDPKASIADTANK